VPLVELEEFKASIYWDSKRTVTDAQAQQALDFGEDRFLKRTFRKRLGYWFDPVETTLTLHGTGLPMLRCIYPILRLDSVIVDGVDITDGVTFNGHFMYRSAQLTFGGVPNTDGYVTYGNVVIEGAFGDPSLERGESLPTPDEDDLTPVVPWDVKDCVMRMAWHQLRRERQVAEMIDDRRGAAQTQVADLAGDRQVNDTIAAWTVKEYSSAFDIR